MQVTDPPGPAGPLSQAGPPGPDGPGVAGPRRYRNTETMVRLADPVWQAAADQGLIGVEVDGGGEPWLTVRGTGHRFVNMCSVSYLGLASHPQILQGAVDALQEVRATLLGVATTRIRHRLQAQVEDDLGELFGMPVLPGLSCSVLSAGILPVLASGHLTGGQPRVMVYDRHAHFSMAYTKPLCAEESLVLTCPHNDLDHLEDICRRYPRVTYVADGAYSMGGATALEGLAQLQDRYGLFLYLDDSHSLSIVGDHGEGFVRANLPANPLTLVVASLAKGFGAFGGVAMLGDPAIAGFLKRHGGPLGWSQDLGVPALGAALASAAIHRTPELAERQRRLHENIALFDRLLPTRYAGDGLAVRRIDVGEADQAVSMSAELFARGWYCSAVFFPIVPRGQAALRIMMRADLTPEQITGLADAVRDTLAAR